MPRVLLISAIALTAACATSPTVQPSPAAPAAAAKTETPDLCTHRVPAETCVKCHPELVERFKKQGDWCPEDDVPESQCLICHPDMKFAALQKLPESADLKMLSTMGEDVPDFAEHVVPGKVTVFDFYAAWCVACRDVDVHLYGLLAAGRNIAVRKLNVMSWDSPLARRYVSQVPALPYLIVYGADGKQVRAISGVKPDELERAIAEGSR